MILKALLGQKPLADFSQAVIEAINKYRPVAGKLMTLNETPNGTVHGVDIGGLRAELGLGKNENPRGDQTPIELPPLAGDVTGEPGANTVVKWQHVGLATEMAEPPSRAVPMFKAGVWSPTELKDLLPEGGSEGDVLKLVEGEPAWAEDATGGSGLPGGGTEGKVLKIVGGVPAWATDETGTTIPSAPSGSTGSLGWIEAYLCGSSGAKQKVYLLGYLG